MTLVKQLVLLLTILSATTLSQAQERSKQDILTSMGKVSKWNAINYILFTSTSKNTIFKERSFLIDKSSGKVRFDGITTNNISLVLLFNYKSKVLTKGYINGKLMDSKSPLIPYQEVMNQLFDDAKLLFLPMFILSTHKSNLTINPEKMVNTEKLIEIVFKNVQNINKQPFNGTIYLNNKGEIKEYILDQTSFLVSDIKDVGDGIVLPTQFINRSTPNTIIKFSTVAAFTDIEDDKFSHL